MKRTVYFGSDHHFGAGSSASQRRRVDRFLRWLEALDDASDLYLLGDVFDFWLDYPTYMPKLHMEVLYGLRKLQDRGTILHFVGGNHDVWCEDFFRDTLGVETLDSGSVIETQGLRIRVHHGDGLLGGDRFYSLFRAVVRNPVLVFLAKSIHPELLHRFADWLSRTSRASDDTSREEILRRIDEYGATADHADVDHLVVGHIHTPIQKRFGSWTFTCLGDWIHEFTAARLRDGDLQLVRVDESGAMSVLDRSTSG